LAAGTGAERPDSGGEWFPTSVRSAGSGERFGDSYPVVPLTTFAPVPAAISGDVFDEILASQREKFFVEDMKSTVGTVFPEADDSEPEETRRAYRTAASIMADSGELEKAEEIYRTILIAFGPSADDCFELGDILYRRGELSAARERFSMAVELDEDFVEARVSLGGVLKEMNLPELAISALEGAVNDHPDYADAYYHLAKLLDETGRKIYAEDCWRRFLALVDPESPAAKEAEEYLK